MTELETMQRAKMYIDKLAQGIDPITDRELPEDSALNNVRLARCFFYVSGILEQVIANDGIVGEKPKLQPFSITPEQLARIQPTQEPMQISQIVDMIWATANNPQMKKLRTTAITDWLLEKGFMTKQPDAQGKAIRVPTERGLQIGLFTQIRQGQYGEYIAVYYSKDAQQFVLDNLNAMLSGQ